MINQKEERKEENLQKKIENKKKIELLLPAGDEECLRAAVANGADAVYLGLKEFNARRNAANFDDLKSVITYCHERGVNVYVAFNTLVKNDEIEEYIREIKYAEACGADAVIIQDQGLIPLIKKNCKKIAIHLSTQATVTNEASLPKGITRMIAARELSQEQLKRFCEVIDTEVFVHGALCVSYSGQCLFSSMVGGRSGNRGVCAQPCRRRYNNKYLLSTMDLCLIEKIPELVRMGVTSLKVEGRMRSKSYVGTVGLIYRKYIDMYYRYVSEGREKAYKIKSKDIDLLKLVFNREFTKGFLFEKSIVDWKMPCNRGLYLGKIKDGKIRLRSDVLVSDGIRIIRGKKQKQSGAVIQEIKKNEKIISKAKKGDIVELCLPEIREYDAVYKTSSQSMDIDLGDEIKKSEQENCDKKQIKTTVKKYNPANHDKDMRPQLCVKVYSSNEGVDADKNGADIIYYDIMADDFEDLKKKITNARLFGATPGLLEDDALLEVVEKIKVKKPDGIFAADRGIMSCVQGYEIHTDYFFNICNDVDRENLNAMPIISLELSLDDIKKLKNKKSIAFVHGDVILMRTKEKVKAPELVDDKKRHFKVRTARYGVYEILNERKIGLFNKTRELYEIGIRYFYVDVAKETAKVCRIYRKILDDEAFDDAKIKKRYTTGHFGRGVK